MAAKVVQQKPRSSTTTRVFNSFLAALRADPTIGEEAAERMRDALTPGRTINASNIQHALIPDEEADLD